MPLNFTETEKPREPVEFFVVDTKARPLELEGEVIPELIRKCGDVKSGRISRAGVEAYLDRNVLVFDRELLANLFNEADYRKEGSLDARALKAALAARYPKRQLHREWRQLTSLLLATPELVLAEDIKDPKIFDGTFNKQSVWDGPPPELPKPPPRRKPKAKKVPGERESTAGQVSSGISTGGTIVTPGGLKSTTQSLAEKQINASLQPSSSSQVPLSTFKTTAQFDALSKGQSMASTLNSMTASAYVSPLTAHLKPGTALNAFGSGKTAVKAWGASLPPSPITISSSALGTLRSSVRNTRAHKPDFVAGTMPLTVTELDLKKTMGQPLDVAVAMNRVEPVRDTRVLPNADYVAWADNASRTCRTAPTRWYNDHPAAPAPQAEHPYPW